MADWHTDRRPTAADADLQGMVRWGPTHPGLLCRWDEVRDGEAWAHSSAWQPAAQTTPLPVTITSGEI